MVLTFLRHGSNVVIVAMVLAIGAAASFGAIALSPLAVLIGVVLFFLSEYSTHRYVLHARPSSNDFILKLQRRLHYDHHVEPNQLELLFLPPWALFPLLAVYGAVYFAITHSVAVTLSVVLGNLLGLLYYEWVHYVAHIPYQPRTPWGRYMKKYHLWHHYKNETLWFGVTNPSLDYVHRTNARVEDVARSTTVRVLFPET
jgi:4-hydroxysphinganine ceramide fatty acyl 2-hydroxylase